VGQERVLSLFWAIGAGAPRTRAEHDVASTARRGEYNGRMGRRLIACAATLSFPVWAGQRPTLVAGSDMGDVLVSGAGPGLRNGLV
jgi:hypothetical protein